MNFQNTSNRLKLVLSVGDESGIGPEIILKALYSNEIPENIDFVIVGSKKNLQNTYRKLKSLGLENLANPKNLNIHDLEISSSDDSKASYGDSSFNYLTKAIEIVKQYPNSALVTGPICKKSWSLAGHYFSGQTEVLAKSCGVKNVGMLFTAKSPITGWRLNTLLATTHIALCEVPKKLTTELIHSKLDLFKDFCSTYVDKPSFKVSGLNPHAGEEGLLGNEEKDWLNDALIAWNENNRDIKLLGPLSPDSCWNSSAKAWRNKDAEKHDGILAMYHDQGLIPMKVIALNYSVNMTIGLPFIRTSPDHGTGFDIAGKGIAESQSMIEAIITAIEMTKSSRLLNTH
ncbi:4-hydroxythreonine-4-phosphate dehydrogenase [Prochlorococcus marinus str. MIT 9312]|uniref:4-hydroxythreonine-4-phosphate dehydrogenase n=1 Tax=Prochlorococcus marinus (strain MIT 9312) TaxID=74546 RepID=Q31DF6_PROM9|nr:4-hydroxythreonine-4-phosphate dehydrogenase PdxA [Prochlorococcus marinus]ABB49089.1 4-hydroxythreonine-4-phosphate dehydrogenase [Prochlorococcus marinus str. MIT 9312]KGF99674.1 4-hydroxythreonine-4-phosphate dehydrogenase [Prochlorococcus marinus str. MIT 9311]